MAMTEEEIEKYGSGYERVLSAIEKCRKNKSKVLDISVGEPTDRYLKVMPEEISSLPWLEYLDLNCTCFNNIEALAELRNLKHLNLSYTNVDSFKDFPEFKNLEFLYLSNTAISSLKFMPKFPRLKHLNLRNTKIHSLEYFPSFSNLRHLNLRGTMIRDFNFFPALPKLEQLDVSGSSIKSLKYFPDLAKLKQLNLGITKISRIEYLPKLLGLEELNLHHTELNSLEHFPHLPELRNLVLSQTRISNLVCLPKFPRLELLDLSESHISNLKGLPNLTKLNRLDLSFSRIKNLDGLPTLTKLTQLFLWGVVLTDVPSEMYYNRRNCADEIVAWRKDLKKGTFLNLTFKVQITGNGRVGKTSLLNRLFFDEFNSREDSTHGIKLVFNSEERSFSKGHRPIRLLCWDFGGQEIYHQVHRLFLKNRAVNLLVFDEDTYLSSSQSEPKIGNVDNNRKLSYWANDIYSNSPDSEVILVQNKFDSGARPIPVEDDIPEEIRYGGPVLVSAKTGLQIDELGKAIHEAVDRLPHAQMKMPLSWWKVREAIIINQTSAQRKRRKISRAFFSRLCQLHQLTLNSEEALLFYLDALGLILYDQELFPNHIILDQQWALDSIYRVLERVNLTVRSTNHQLSIAEFQEACRFKNGEFVPSRLPFNRDTTTQEERKLFLQIMVRAGICFQTKAASEGGEPVYVLFHLMHEGVTKSAEELWQAKADMSTLSMYYHNRYHLHRGIFRSLVQEIIYKVKLNHLWQDGLLLQLPDGTTAKLEMNYADDQVEIQARGAKAAQLLLLFGKVLDEQLSGESFFRKIVGSDRYIDFNFYVDDIKVAGRGQAKMAKTISGEYCPDWQELTWCLNSASEYDWNNLPEIQHEVSAGLDEDPIEKIKELATQIASGKDVSPANPERIKLIINNYEKGSKPQVNQGDNAQITYVAGDQHNHPAAAQVAPSFWGLEDIHRRSLLRGGALAVLALAVSYYFLWDQMSAGTLLTITIVTICAAIFWALGRTSMFRRVGWFLITSGITTAGLIQALPLLDGFTKLNIDRGWLSFAFKGRTAIEPSNTVTIIVLLIGVMGGCFMFWLDYRKEQKERNATK